MTKPTKKNKLGKPVKMWAIKVIGKPLTCISKKEALYYIDFWQIKEKLVRVEVREILK